MEITIDFAQIEELPKVVELSKKFELENCCNGIIADDLEFFKSQRVAVAKADNDIVGYCYGNISTKAKTTSFCKQGEKSFYIEEIYIEKKYRNKKIGLALFKFMENYAISNGCSLIETTAVSKDYLKLLSFYINKLDMKFLSASLFKKLN